MGCVWAEFNSQHPDHKFMYNLKEFKDIFDPLLEEFITTKVNSLSRKTGNDFVQDFILYSKQLITNGGKRTRPYLAYLMYIALGGQSSEEAIKFFISLEVFHAFALVHDDIMDKSKLRRGVKTIHTYVLEHLRNNNRLGDLEHIGNSQGILMGDLFFAWSIEIFDKVNEIPQDNIDKAKVYFFEMTDDVILGQMLDVDLKTRKSSTAELVYEKNLMKSARYSFIYPLLIGSGLANTNHQYEKFCKDIGEDLGMAFQTQNDLADIIGDEKTVRKDVLGDIEEGEHTFFTNFVFDNGTKEQKDYLLSVFGKPIPSTTNRNKIRKLFIETGAVTEGEKVIHDSFQKAKNTLEKSSLKNEYKEIFFGLIKMLEERKN